MRTPIKILHRAVFALLLLCGGANSAAPNEPSKEISSIQSSIPNWYDDSRGGVYGIGEGWSIELLPAEYRTFMEPILDPPIRSNLIKIQGTYEWVKDDSEDLSGDPVMGVEVDTIPAEYETVTETIIVKPENTDYYLTDATYNPDGSLNTPRTVLARYRPAEIRQEERQVVKVQERYEERLVPLERRKGYRLVVKTPPRFAQGESRGTFYQKQHAEKTRSWRFRIKNPEGEVAHVFDTLEELSAFTDSLNQPIGGLWGKSFKILKVNDYVVSKDQPEIKARFKKTKNYAFGEIHLLGTCNPTWGNVSMTYDPFILFEMGHLGQTACTELVELPDGRTIERVGQTPSSRTEDEFISLGDKVFRIQWSPNEAHFIDLDGKTFVILEH